MSEKYFSLSDIKADFEWLQQNGCDWLSLREVIERLENLIPTVNLMEVKNEKEN